MPDETQLPFHSFSFTLVADRKPRAALRMKAAEEGFFELHVEKGPASRPTTQFTRLVPGDVAERLRDELQSAGAFGWDEAYSDDPARKTLRWSMSVVFREGLFSVASKGGNQTPSGFDAVLEALYRLDFPRADNAKDAGVPTPGPSGAQTAPGMRRALSAGDLSAYAAAHGVEGALSAAGIDYSSIAEGLSAAGLGASAPEELGALLEEAQRNPQALQRRMRDEFAHLNRDEQEQMLDALERTGTATREWWRRFLLGL